MRQSIVIFVLFCGFVGLAFCQSIILQASSAGYADVTKPNSILSSDSYYPKMCKESIVSCNCDGTEKATAFFRWDNVHTLFQSYNNVEITDVFALLGYSCSGGGGSWNGARVYTVEGGYWSPSTLTFNNKPTLTQILTLTQWNFKIPNNVMDAVFKGNYVYFSLAMDSGSMNQSINFYGARATDQTVLAIYYKCKPGWTFDNNRQCTVSTPLPPVAEPVAPPVEPPVDAPVESPLAAPAASPIDENTPVTSSPSGASGPISEGPAASDVPVSVEEPSADTPVSAPSSDITRPIGSAAGNIAFSGIILASSALLSLIA